MTPLQLILFALGLFYYLASLWQLDTLIEFFDSMAFFFVLAMPSGNRTYARSGRSHLYTRIGGVFW